MIKTMNNNAICAIVICYYGVEKELLQQFKAIRNQVSQIVYVINKSAGKAESLISLVSTLPEVTIIRNTKNEGVGYALNQGIAHAKRIGCEYVLFLDQDSTPYPDMVHQLLSAHALLCRSTKVKVAAVGPVCIDANSADHSYFVRFRNYKLEKIYCSDIKAKNPTAIPSDFLISSGALTKIDIFNAIGEMDSKLFIDHIDTEWFLRAKSIGYQAYGICNAFMEHRLGNKTRKIWFGKWVRISHHSSFRHYYLFRNAVIIMRRSYIRPHWKICETRRLIIIFFYFILFSDENIRNLLAMIKGLIDGIYVSSISASKPTESLH
jgi:rhamnosyltransferase